MNRRTFACGLGSVVAGLPSRCYAQSEEGHDGGRAWKKIPFIVVVSAENDARLPAVREAVSFWNTEFLRLGCSCKGPYVEISDCDALRELRHGRRGVFVRPWHIAARYKSSNLRQALGTCRSQLATRTTRLRRKRPGRESLSPKKNGRRHNTISVQNGIYGRSGLRPANITTLDHFSVSSATNLVKRCAAEPAARQRPRPVAGIDGADVSSRSLSE